MIYFTSDTHFHHANIIKYCNRPFSSTEEMNEVLIKNWNDTVKPEDTVYHLGDFCFARDIYAHSKILSSLNGTKHLVYGNHDKSLRTVHEFTRHFASLSDILEIRHHNTKIVLCHFSMRVWDKSHHGSWHLFGHSHGSLPPFGKSVDVGVDSASITGNAEYRPFSFDEIISFMNKQEVSEVDHHIASQAR